MIDTNGDVTTTKRRDQHEWKLKTTTRDDKMILQNTFKDLRKTSKNLQRDLATAGVNVDSSTIKKATSWSWKKSQKSLQEAIANSCYEKETLKMG